LYPFFEIFWIKIYLFGIALAFCFFLFVGSLRYLSSRFSYNFSFFANNIIWYFLSVFIFSRLFFVISRWSDMKFIKDPFEFFIMNNYNFSLFGAIFWFLLVLWINIKIEKTTIQKYIDAVVLSFFFVLPLGYLGALLGGQVYWRETMLWIEILYTHPFTLVPYQVPVFPLAIVYAICMFLIFCGLYMISIIVHIRGFVWYLGLLLFSALILILEFFSGKFDIISSVMPFNLNQILAIILVWVSAYKLYHIYLCDITESSVVKK